MKTLLILRHAKSLHPPGVADFNRDLAERGWRDATRVGELLVKKTLIPDLIITSPATRARQTVKQVVAACDYAGQVLECDDIYEGHASHLLDALRRIPEHINSVMIVGHNPGLHEFVQSMTGSVDRFPTAALAAIELSFTCWDELPDNLRGHLRLIWTPKGND